MYTVQGWKKDREIVPNTSLREMMKEQPDFLEDESLLEYNAKRLGACSKVMKPPKCHPVLAGEGIENHWALEKSHYCRLPMREKKGKENFLNSVRESIAKTNLSIARQFSRRTREYILAYH